MNDRLRGRMLAGLVLLLAVAPTTVRAQLGSRGFNSPPGAGPTSNNPRPRYQPPVLEQRGPQTPVVQVRITGNETVPESKIRMHLQTRPGRGFDAEVVQGDVRRLSATGLFRNVRTYKNEVDGGVVVTFEVFELPTIHYVRFVGNEQVKEKALRKQIELRDGEALHRYRVEEARRKLEEFYREKGYSEAKVTIQEGDDPQDRGVVFAIYEGPLQRIWKTRFVGNTIVSDARLKTQIESKPGILWLFKGKLDQEQLDADVQRLTAYYRSLGYFKARVGRYLEGDSEAWPTVTFVIDEGPRYKIRNVAFVGNEQFTTESLASRTELKAGEFFDARKMSADLNSLRDAYGSHGYIHADIKADPRFLEDPGMLDLVYDIEEGDQYRVGRVIVNIEGDNPHTRRDVVINRLSHVPGEIIDIRKIREDERRLRSSQLFLTDPVRGIAPSIAILPPEMRGEASIADQRGEDSDRVRGQQPY